MRSTKALFVGLLSVLASACAVDVDDARGREGERSNDIEAAIDLDEPEEISPDMETMRDDDPIQGVGDVTGVGVDPDDAEEDEDDVDADESESVGQVGVMSGGRATAERGEADKGRKGVTFETVFSVPKGDGKADKAIENRFIELVESAAKGSKIRISVFHLTSMPVATALVRASKSGVDVRVVLDGDGRASDEDEDPKDEAAVKILLAGLKKGHLKLCRRGAGACIGDGINHNKLFLFSKLADGSRNVVVQGSANLTASKMHNNMVIVKNDRRLYRGYARHFRALEKAKKNLDYYRKVKGEGTIAYFFPRQEGDTIVSILDNVQCRDKATIRVAMAFFTEGRKEIAERLAARAKEGCDVKVVMRPAGAKLSDASIVKRLRAGGVVVGEYPTKSGNNIHSKYLLIDAPYKAADGKHYRRKLVYTGSHNYTQTALAANDETLLRIADDRVWSAFTKNWETIKKQTK